MKLLHELTKEEYKQLMRSGLLWEIFPDAVGVYKEDSEPKRGDKDNDTSLSN